MTVIRHLVGATVLPLTMTVLLTGCAGRLDYRPPSRTSLSNTVTVQKSKDAVWKQLIPALGKEFFVINNIDKESGIVNISYSGDPERYIDCGEVSSYVKNARGERTHQFPGARAYVVYEVMNNNRFLVIERKMNVEGRVNVIVEEVEATSTRVMANTRYVVTRTTNVRDAQGRSQTFTHTINFNSGQGADFPAAGNAPSLSCVATGQLEREILDLVNK